MAGQVDLERWIKACVGRLYLTPSGRGPRSVVRRFVGDGVEGRAGVYAEIVTGFEEWVASHPDVAEFVEVFGLTETGSDFVTRPFKVFAYSLDSYDEYLSENSIEDDEVGFIPEELIPMRERVLRHLTGEETGRTGVLEEVIRGSLLGPNPTTVIGDEGRWRVVSPSVRIEHLERWAAR